MEIVSEGVAAEQAPFEVLYAPIPCRDCGDPITLDPPRRLFVNPVDGSAKILAPEGFGPPQQCPACRVRLAPTALRDSIRRHFEGWGRTRDELGFPPDAMAWHIVADPGAAKLPKRLRGVHLDFLALAVNGGAFPEDAPVFPFAVNGLSLLFYFRAATVEGVPAAHEHRWHPERGGSWAIRFADPPRPITTGDRKCLLDAWELFVPFERGGGRPKHRTTWSRENFLDRLPAARAAVEDRTGRRATDGELATELGISAPTFGRYKKRWLGDANY